MTTTTRQGVRRPTDISVQVGKRIRGRRHELKLSQEELAAALGVTFQQLQKYENGTNRVSVDRLAVIATALDVAPEYFFRGARGVRAASKQASRVDELLATRDGVVIANCFMRIRNSEVRRKIAETIALLADRRQQVAE